MSDKVYFPLTSPQLSIWYTERKFPGTSISNVAGTLRIKQKIDFSLLEQAINLFIKNNDGMRIRINLDDNGDPRQYISEYSYRKFDIIDFSHETDPLKAMYLWDSFECLKPFQLLEGDLFKFILVRINDNDGGFFINTHHIISDAWGMGIMGNSIVRYYNSLRKGNNDSEELEPSYISFIQNEQDYKSSARFSKDQLYWDEIFTSQPETTVLKTRKTSVVLPKAKRKTFVLPAKFINKLREYCDENKTSSYTLFMAALAMYINRVTGREDIILGTPILNRTNQTEKRTFGMFISTIPVRVRINGESDFLTFAQGMTEICSASLRHQRYPFDTLLKQVREKHHFNDQLFDIILSYQNSKFQKESDIEYTTRWHFSGYQSNSLNMHINDRDNEGSLIVDYDYQTDLYFDKEIEFIHSHVLSLLWHALDNPKKPICKVEMLTESEKKKILHDFNNTRKEYPKDKTFQQLFEEQAERTPGNVALIFENKSMTYKELNEKANSLAHLLRNRGVMPEDIVGIMVSRSFEMVIGMLAVLKAGGAFLPVDHEYPENRIVFMLDDCKVKTLLIDKSCTEKDKFKSFDPIDISDENIYSASKKNLFSNNMPTNLAYIIYTSGSTGNPKGAMIEHKSLTNFAYAMFNDTDYTKIKRVLSVGSFSFDIFMIELVPSLLTGAAMVISSEIERKDPKRLSKLISEHKVDMVVATPSQINSFIKDHEFSKSLSRVYEIILGGESVSEQLLNSLKEKSGAIVVNVYGPTETTVIVTTKKLEKDSPITIGSPIINTKIFILDKNLLPVPIGIEGEIYISGAGLGRGYHNRPELTAQRFIDNPYLTCEKMYKTGDLGRWYAQGEIEYLGRSDFQVKIRGLRIELGEIEKRLSKIDGISKAVVNVIQQNDIKMICAYYIADKEIDTSYMRVQLAKHLPAYMIPGHFMRVDRINLSPNGKVDYKSLPQPNIEKLTSENAVLPRNEAEKGIYEIWSEVLGSSSFGVTEDFFNVGGDSLSIIQIAVRIFAKYGVNIPVYTMNEISTIEKMAEYINNNLSRKEVFFSKSIVKLKEGYNSNIFFVHPGNGEVGRYGELSERISDEFNVWSFQVDDELIENKIYDSIESIAEYYVAIVKEIQPKGPYTIGGSCVGGTISFEMARILEENGDKVNSLYLFNSISPRDWKRNSLFTESDERRILEKCLKNCDDLPESNQDQWNLVFNSIMQNRLPVSIAQEIVPKNIEKSLPESSWNDPKILVKYLKRVLKLHKTRAEYIPKNKIAAAVYFFSAVYDRNISNISKNIERWNKYCFDLIRNFNVNADHYTLLSKPSVDIVGKIVNESVAKSREEIV